MILISVPAARSGMAVVAAALAAFSLASCAAKESDKNSSSASGAATEVTVNATDTSCELSKTEARPAQPLS